MRGDGAVVVVSIGLGPPSCDESFVQLQLPFLIQPPSLGLFLIPLELAHPASQTLCARGP